MYKEHVVDYFGSQANVAKMLGLTRQALQLWEDIIPEKHALKLERLTKDEKYPLIYVPELYEDLSNGKRANAKGKKVGKKG